MPARHLAATPVRFRLLTALVATATVAGAAVVGRLSAPHTATVPRSPSYVAPGFAHSPDGAEAAAAWFVEQVYGARGQRLEGVRARFRSLVSRPDVLDRVVRAVSTDSNGDQVPEGTTTRVAAIGVHPEVYQPAGARVTVWSVIVSIPPGATGGTPSPTGSAGSAGASTGPAQRWQLDIVSLEWREGIWQLAASDVVDGPMPPPDPDQQPNAVGAAAELVGSGDTAFQAVPDGH